MILHDVLAGSISVPRAKWWLPHYQSGYYNTFSC